MPEGRLSLSALWLETLESFNAHRTIFITLAAAFIFLPQMALALLMPSLGDTASVQKMMTEGAPWLFPMIAVILLINLLAIVPITRVVLGLVAPQETVGAMLLDTLSRLPRMILAGLWLVLLYLGVTLLLSIPFAIILTVVAMAAPKAVTTTGGPVTVVLIAAMLAVLLYLGARVAVWFPVLIAENLGARATVRRAWSLTRGQASRILLILLALTFAAILVSALFFALGSAVGVVGQTAGGASIGLLLFQLVNSGFSALFGLFFYILFALMYRRLAR